MNTESVLLDKLYFGATAAVSAQALRSLSAVHRDHVLGHARAQQELSHASDQMLLAITSYALKSRHLEKTVTNTVEVPTSWWDHLKHDMLNGMQPKLVWLAGLFKAPNYTTIVQAEIHETRVCPHNDTYFSDSQQHIHYLLWRADDNGNRLE